jgi:hypothetical protein
MTKDEALRLALEALEAITRRNQSDHQAEIAEEAITAIKAALEAKDEPVKLRRGDILRCIETDELCTVWATSTSGKTLVKWGGNDFTDYTAEQIGELFWLETKDEPVAWRAWVSKFPQGTNSDWVYVTKPIMKDSIHNQPLYTTPPQRTWVGLTDEEIQYAFKTNSVMVDNGNAYMVAGLRAVNIAQAIEAKLKEKNNG